MPIENRHPPWVESGRIGRIVREARDYIKRTTDTVRNEDVQPIAQFRPIQAVRGYRQPWDST
jgi:hypothetical protein